MTQDILYGEEVRTYSQERRTLCDLIESRNRFLERVPEDTPCRARLLQAMDKMIAEFKSRVHKHHLTRDGEVLGVCYMTDENAESLNDKLNGAKWEVIDAIA